MRTCIFLRPPLPFQCSRCPLSHPVGPHTRRLLAKVGRNLDVMPGEEFRVALREAHAIGAQVGGIRGTSGAGGRCGLCPCLACLPHSPSRAVARRGCQVLPAHAPLLLCSCFWSVYVLLHSLACAPQVVL